MQRDLKIGISLCVLMFGVVGALMFRREQPATNAQNLQLKTARQLDQKIAQRSRTPYMTGMTGDIETDGDADATKSDPQDGTRPTHLLPPNHLLEDDDDDVLTPMPGVRRHLAGRPTQSGSGISPIRPRGDIVPRIVTEDITVGPQTHTIQAGDTLSTLAEKYLGGQKHAKEIFEANRTVLSNPNRLPEGVVITIPPPVSKDGKSVAAKSKDVRSVSEQGSAKEFIAHETRRPNDDLTEFQPIAPPSGQARERADVISGQPFIDSIKTESGSTNGKASDPKAVETRKKLFTPGRLPFGNNLNTHSAAQRKALDPDGEAFPGVKEVRDTDPAHGATKQIYQVRKGDSLERISQKVYGNPKRATDIFNANRDKLTSPSAVKEGLELQLP